ncbi:methyltransferase type 11 domain-containing protein [Botrytis cinerea]
MTVPNSDPTFRNYTSKQAATYAAHRLSYPAKLYETVINHHEKTGASCDAGEAMIGTAREMGGKTKIGKDIVWVIGSGEEFTGLEEVGEGTLDLITVAMAVHWFDMDKFWAQVAKALKPGGTLLPNRLSRDMYDNLPLPWNIPHPIPSSVLPESQFLKLDYDRDGILSDPESDDFFFGGREVTLKQAEKSLETASMVTRWREAHPEMVGTEKDVLKLHMEELRKAMGGNESMRTGSGTTIILVKKALDT